MTQPVDEPLEDALVVQQPQAGLVVDLVADDRRVLAVTRHDGTDDPLRVEEVRRVGEVDLLARAPADRLARRTLARDLGIAALEPHRDRVGRRPEDHADATLVGLVEHRLEPVEVEDAFLGLPCRPHGLADADHREPRLRHQVEVGFEVRRALVLRVVGGTEADGLGPVFRHRRRPVRGGTFAVGPALGLPLRVGDGRGQEQPLGVGVLRVAGDLGAVARLDDLALVHHRDAVAEVAHHVEVVGDEQVGDAGAFLDLQEQRQHAGLGGEVERGDGLVADDQLGRERQRAGDRDALPLAAAELPRQAAAGVAGQVDLVEQVLDPLGGLGLAARSDTVSGSVRICSIVIAGFRDV